MSFRLGKKELSRYADYHVEILTTRVDKSYLLSGKAERKERINRIIATLMLTLMAFFMVSQLFAPKANADIFEDAVGKLVCTSGQYNFQTENKGVMTTTTGDGFRADATAYEKYGMSGTTWASLLGFSPADYGSLFGDKSSILANGGKGAGSSAGIVGAVGKDAQASGLDQWSREITKNPDSGLWNRKDICSWGSTLYARDWAANLTTTGTKAIIWASNYIFEIATSDSLTESLSDPLNKIGKALKTNLYLQYLTPMIMISALYVGYIGMIKRQGAKVLGYIAWSVGVIAVSVVMMSNLSLIPAKVNGISSSISQTIMSTSNISSQDNDLCKATGKNAAVRSFQCNQWYTFVFDPWVKGQFGMSHKEMVEKKDFDKVLGTSKAYADSKMSLDNLKDAGGSTATWSAVKLGNRQVSSQSFALYMLDHKSNWDNALPSQKDAKARMVMNVAAHELGSERMNEVFKGMEVNDRNTIAMLNFTGALGVGLFVVSVSFGILMAELMIILYASLFPLVALFAFVNAGGRRMAINYSKKILSEGLNRIILTVILASYIMFIQAISTASMHWILAIILMLVITVGAFTGKQKLAGMFSDVFGSSSLSSSSNIESKATKAMANRGKAVGKVAMSVATGKGLRNRSTNQSAKDILENAVANAGAGRAPQDKSFASKSAKGSNNGQAGHESAGSGEKPQEGTEQPENDYQNNHGSQPQTAPESESEDYSTEGSGAGESPQGSAVHESETEQVEQPLTRAQAKQKRKDQKMVQKREIAHVREQLERHGYRPRVPLSTFVTGVVAGTAVGLVTGNSTMAHRVSSGIIQKKRNQIAEGNAYAVNKVRNATAQHNWEVERANAINKFKFDQERKREAREKAKQESAKHSQNRNQAPQQKQETESQPKQSAPKVAVKPEVRTPQQMQENAKQDSASQQKQTAPKPTVKLPTPRSNQSPVSDSKRSESVKLPTPRPRAEKRSEPGTGATKPSVKRTPPLPPRRERRNEPPVPNKGGANFRK